MYYQKGMSFLEIIAFVLILGILGVAIPLAYLIVGKGIGTASENIDAFNLARSRMELILGQKAMKGFNNDLSTLDFCRLGSLQTENSCQRTIPVICQCPPSLYVNTSILPPPSGWNTSLYKLIQVTVSGSGQAKLFFLEGNY